ncbi:MAG: hypothetical protein ABEJ88_09080 [Halobacterium sp.]
MASSHARRPPATPLTVSLFLAAVLLFVVCVGVAAVLYFGA